MGTARSHRNRFRGVRDRALTGASPRELRKATGVRALRSAYLKHVANSSAVGRDGVRPQDLEVDWDATATLLQRKLRSGAYRFSPYRRVLLLKGEGKPPRALSIPNARDRVALRAVLNALIDAIDYAGRELPQAMASRFIRAWESDPTRDFVRIDLIAYYDSIDHDHLTAALRQKVRSRRLRELVMAAVKTGSALRGAPRPAHPNRRGVPQGMALSNILGDVFLESFDLEFERRSEVEFFRYVDDVIALCPAGSAVKIFGDMRSLLEGLGLEVHEPGPNGKSSTGSVSEEFEFLGYRFHDKVVGVRKASVRRLEDSLIRAIVDYRYQLSRPPSGTDALEWSETCARRLQWKLDLLVTGCRFEESRRGWLPYFLCITDLSELARLDRVLNGMLRRRKIPDSVRPKSFMRAYWAWNAGPRSKRRDYIPNFDGITTTRKRKMLIDLLGVPPSVVSDWTKTVVDAEFSRRMGWLVRQMERDIGSPS